MINKKMVIISTLVAIIIAVGLIYMGLKNVFDLFSDDDTGYNQVENQIQNENTDNNTEENTIMDENKLDNKDDEETKTEKEDEKKVEENKVSDSETNKVEKEADQKLDDEDKAIELAKQEWGKDDNNVYYYIEEQVSDNVYIISVRDQSTTQDLVTYKVNVKKETVGEY